VEEGEGETSGSAVTRESESWIGEGGNMGEDMGDTGSYFEGEGNLSFDMGDEI